MNTEHDLARARSAPHAAPPDDDLAPGRGSRSSELAAPSHPIAGGLLLRKARDASGVAEGAEGAVAAASSSTGSSLPGPILRKFESSLGADLSGVRVHTGGESQAAAASIGARAYTVGQNIHFAEGQYDPSSAAGQHLIAHEVAHTVQQRGGATHRQNKLEVSSPGDPAEVEADRAADSILRGEPALVANATASINRKLMRQTPAGGSAGSDEQAAGSSAAKVPGHWQPPFGLQACNDRATACAMLIDIVHILQEFKDAGFAECQPVIDQCNAQAYSLPGADPLTEEEAKQLSVLGLLAKASHEHALNEMKQAISAQLAAWTSSADFSGIEGEIADALHASFKDDAGKNKLTQLKELSSKVRELGEKVQKYASWAANARSVVAAAGKFEELSKAMEGFNSLLGQADDVLKLAESIATLTGLINEKPGSTANDIAKFKAGLNIVNFAISKSDVPLIGTYWSSYIKPMTDLALSRIGALSDHTEKFDRNNVIEWWGDVKDLEVAPEIAASPVPKNRWPDIFPGGQAMLNFMWQLMRGGVTTVPPGVEGYFQKFKDQFNVGHDDSDSIQEQSNWHVLHPSTWGNKATLPNLPAWLNKNKAEAWAMIYGSLPHP
jgi:hypothetical protein